MAELKPLTKKVALADGVTVNLENGVITVKGPKGELSRNLNQRIITIAQDGNDAVVDTQILQKKWKKQVNTVAAHIRNMNKGVTEGFTYELVAVFKHFPMNIESKGNKFIVKNFLGEKVPRECSITEGVDVNVSGQSITLTGTDKEKVGTMASRLELLTKVSNRDRRVFQDGIFIVKKDGKEI